MTKEIREECWKIQQGAFSLYIFVMHSTILRKIAVVSERDASNPKGYQRHLNPSRVKEVGEYIRKPRATFPNSIIVNLDSRKGVRFEPSSNPKHGTIILSDEPGLAWIIDGQHRVFGFTQSEGKEFDLIVVAFIDLSISDQATIFKVINSTQKGVNPSLIYDLIELTRDVEFYTERAHEIVKALNEHEDSPWHGQIKMVGTGTGSVSQAAFIGELRPLLKDPTFKTLSFNAGDEIRLFKDYFSAIKTLYSDAWASKRHVLTKTLGLAALLAIMPRVLIHCITRSNFDQTTMIDILRPVTKYEHLEIGGEPIDFSSRQLGAFGGRQGQRKLAEMLEAAIPLVRPTAP